MKIAILGASGFIGQSLVKKFAQEHEVFSFGRRASPFGDEISYTAWDIRSPISFPHTFDVCIDLASDVDYLKSTQELFDTNVSSFHNREKFLQKALCKHCIHISSSSVYMGISGKISEDVSIDSKQLSNSYALTKYLAEEAVKKMACDGMKITILRPRAVYGIGDTTLLPKILSSQIFSYLLLPGNGKTLTSLTSLENLTESIEVVIRKQKSTCEIYNVADAQMYTYEEIYSLLVKKYGLRGIIRIPRFIIKIFTFLAPNRWSYLFDTFFREKALDISKIQKLGYTPRGNIASFLHSHEKLP